MAQTFQRMIFGILLFSVGLPMAAADEPNHDYTGPLELPEIARYHSLPTRLFLRSEFQDDEFTEILPPKFVEVFTRVLDGNYDNGLHCDAAQSLERVAKKGLADKQVYLPALRNRLHNSDSRIVLSACALALIAADDHESAESLAALCRPDNEVLCLRLEPKLAEWKSSALLATWQTRLSSPNEYTSHLNILACECLAIAGDTNSVDTLAAGVRNNKENFSVRKAAAAAVAVLDQNTAKECAADFATGTLPERLLAVALLKSAEQPDALALLTALCEDSEKAVAAVAWDYLEQQDRQQLVEKLPKAIRHPEPNVRKVAVRVLRVITSDQHTDLLNKMLNDEHIFVRNHAREALDHIASSQPELRPRILENAASVMADSESTWQSLEQSMLILGRQRHGEYQTLCVPLLSHPRNEVLATAGWLLHLMPREELAKPIVQMAKQQFEFVATKATLDNTDNCMARSNQLMYLFHHSAYTKREDIKEVASEMFSKAAPVHQETRAAGIWALSVIFSGQTDDDLRSKFSERLHDDDPMDPETFFAKAASALSLGILGMPVSGDDLNLAHSKYGVSGKLAACVRSALRMLGESPDDAPVLPPLEVGNWPIMPSRSRN